MAGDRQMKVYRIVNVRREHPNGQILLVEVRKDTGQKLKKRKRLPVKIVAAMINSKKSSFYTFDLQSQEAAGVYVVRESEMTHRLSIRSAVDRQAANNIENMGN
jgi:hypothetical protein